MRRRTFLSASAAAAAIAGIGGCERQNAEPVPPPPAPPTPEALELPSADDEADSSNAVELGDFEGVATPALGASLIEPVDATQSQAVRSLIYTKALTQGAWPAPPLDDSLKALISQRRYWEIGAADRPVPNWPDLLRAPDYRHLESFAQPAAEEFELTAEALTFLAERNSFQFADRQGVRIFGLRGCALSSPDEARPFASAHALRVRTPGHLSCECVMGVWRPADNMIAVFRASTTPSASNMFKALPAAGYGASLLPTGKYRYRAGTHKASDPKKAQTGALLMDQDYVVLRTTDDLSFDPYQTGDVWTRGAAHNIHSTGRFRDGPDVFDSAGCQVVRGYYDINDRTRCNGPWAAFRRDAGLVDTSGSPTAEEAPGAGSFEYMLLTGQEAALAASKEPGFLEGYFRLRPGSSGQSVLDYKQKLSALFPDIKLAAVDRFDSPTSFATLILHKDRQGEFASVVTEPLA
ncbi:MAG: hypothetical protein KGS00_04965 [Alphaproteobacteria bacterium]|nr:hypothetical protein [Alphaproteobacteria bacterium]